MRPDEVRRAFEGDFQSQGIARRLERIAGALERERDGIVSLNRLRTAFEDWLEREVLSG